MNCWLEIDCIYKTFFIKCASNTSGEEKFDVDIIAHVSRFVAKV